jgi:hypothetical protein
VPAVGLEHVVANMFLLPLGLLGGADLSIADTIVKNFVPTTIGNAIAGAVVVAASYSYQFGKLGNTTPSSIERPDVKLDPRGVYLSPLLSQKPQGVSRSHASPRTKSS